MFLPPNYLYYTISAFANVVIYSVTDATHNNFFMEDRNCNNWQN